MTEPTQFDYESIEIDHATVTTMVPYTEEPEYREYSVSSGAELETLLFQMEDPAHAERVVDVELN